jgi:hypothetical protein
MVFLSFGEEGVTLSRKARQGREEALGLSGRGSISFSIWISKMSPAARMGF